MIAVVRTDEEGTVVETSLNASALLGRCMGKKCSDLMRATDRDKSPICTGTCIRTTHGITDISGATVNGRNGRFLCIPMTKGRHIIWLPWEKESAVGLTPREVDVLSKIAQGMNSAEIATELGIKASTVRTHVENAREKLMARTRAELVAKSIISGRINPDI